MPMIPVKEATKGVAISEPEVKEHEVDLLIVGGGMGACGVAYEAVRWGDKHGLKIMLCDKAALERSGAVAQGLSAINTYLGENSADDYVRMVRTDLMGLVREDLIFDVGRHVDDSVHLFEDWGLPCWIKGDDGHNLNGAAAKAAGKSLRKGDKPVRSGRWQIMINGESYKCIVAEAAKNALGEDRIMERIFIVKLLLDTGFNLLAMMEEDSQKLAARDLHELLRCWENYHRLWTVRLHMQHIAFREESRYPGFYYRADFMGLDDSKWKCFVNSKYDPATGETKIFKKPYYQIIPD